MENPRQQAKDWADSLSQVQASRNRRQEENDWATVCSNPNSTERAKEYAGGKLFGSTSPIVGAYTKKYNGIFTYEDIWDAFTETFVKASTSWNGQDAGGFYMSLYRDFGSRLRDLTDVLFRRYDLEVYTKRFTPTQADKREGFSLLRKAIRLDGHLHLTEEHDDLYASPSAELSYEAEVNAEIVNSLVSVLSRKDRLILAYSYGIEGNKEDPFVEDLTKRDFVTRILGYSTESVRLLDKWNAKAILKLRTKMAEFGLTAEDFGYGKDDTDE